MQRHITVARTVTAIEWLILGGLVLFAFTGGRAALVDKLGPRADLVVLVAALASFGLLHKVINRYLVPALERYFSPAPYDERRILFDLGLQARAATNIDQLYKLIVTSIGEALETESVSILVREDGTGDYVHRISRSRQLEQRPDQQGGTLEQPSTRLALARDAFVVRRLNNLAVPLAVTQADFEAWEKAFTSAPRAIREARESERDTLLEIKSSLLLQIRIKDQLVGILSLGPRRAGHQYSVNDKEMLMSIAGQLAFVIENSRLVEQMVAEERLRRELALAAQVQQRLFPASPPVSRSLELAGYCQPARGVGGDYYDFLVFDNDQIGVAVADVAGKGISAALVMSIVQASLRSQTMSPSQSSLSELVSTMNRLLCRSTDAATYVTFFYAQIDERTQRLAYVNAGHNPPVLLRAHPAIEADKDASPTSLTSPESSQNNGHGCYRLTEGGPVIGLFEGCAYEQGSIEIRSGDLLLAYTDGLTEALNLAGEEFGEERLQEVITQAAQLSAEEIRGSVVRCVQSWCAGAPQHDDLTLIVVKVK